MGIQGRFTSVQTGHHLPRTHLKGASTSLRIPTAASACLNTCESFSVDQWEPCLTHHSCHIYTIISETSACIAIKDERYRDNELF